MKTLALWLFVIAACWSTGAAQNSNQPSLAQTPAPAALPAARPGDVDSVEHILAAIYDVISGPAGAPRDWDRFRSLFYSGARMTSTRRDDKGAVIIRTLTPDDYPARTKEAFAKDGFFENAVANHIEHWDHMAHAWSSYESRHAKGEKPFARGINSFQLVNDGNRWWILSVYWKSEDAAHPVPDQYLK
jgi:hypothetical protein